ncbi:MAG: hypothetical protein RBT61_00420 [Candidatus Kapabacteria bacterium]|jgi:hypothetical protein|nr:hypothetical protein [Candidatus Kapabacteria bacterium]
MKKILTILFICVGLNAFSQELDPITTTNLRVIINRINTLQGLIGSGGGNGVTAEWVRNEISDSISAIFGNHKVLDINTQTSATYTLVLADAHRLVIRSNSSANTVTVPTNTSVAFPVGTQITVVQTGTGTTSIAAAGGVTINSADDATALRVRYSACSLVKIDTNIWLLIGDIE